MVTKKNDVYKTSDASAFLIQFYIMFQAKAGVSSCDLYN